MTVLATETNDHEVWYLDAQGERCRTMAKVTIVQSDDQGTAYLAQSPLLWFNITDKHRGTVLQRILKGISDELSMDSPLYKAKAYWLAYHEQQATQLVNLLRVRRSAYRDKHMHQVLDAYHSGTITDKDVRAWVGRWWYHRLAGADLSEFWGVRL